MEPKMVVSLVSAIGILSAADEGGTDWTPNGRTGNRIARSVIPCWNRIDEPVVAAGVISGDRIAGDLDIGGFRSGRLGPVRGHIDPEFVAVRIEEVHDRRTP
jgi:hypothetical protein